MFTTKKVYLSKKFEAPGPRYRDEGLCSAEEFLEDFLLPIMRNEKTVILNIDATFGIHIEFLDEIALRVTQEFGKEASSKLLLESFDEPCLCRIFYDLVEEYKNIQKGIATRKSDRCV